METRKKERKDHRLTEFTKYEKLPPYNVVWDGPDEIPAMSKLLGTGLK